MKLQNQVCTLEQAKRLKELGLEGPSLCFWRVYEQKRSKLKRRAVLTYQTVGTADGRCWREVETYPAFTVAELGRALHMDANGTLPPRLWHIDRDVYFPATAEAHFRASMLIHLMDERIVAADDINNRLISAA